jgi:tRNA pseudouridine38-40 synthase
MESEARGGPARRIALLLEYDGTRYQGFQLQASAPTIQGELERAIQALTGVRVKAASRTDSGAHARGQVVAFTTSSGYPPQVFLRALNHYLPPDIKVRGAWEAAPGFDPRRQARSRVYRYTILNSETPSPLVMPFAHWVREPLDVEAMARAASLLLGTHDFAPFAGKVPGRRSTVRRVYRWDVWREGELVIMEAEANAFLPHQVRRTAGALVAVGLGRMTLEEFGAILEGRRELKGTALPARGLCLMRVKYDDKE